MTFRGTIQDGKVILDPGASLPNGTRVDIQPAKPAVRARTRRPATASKSKRGRGLLSLLDHTVSANLPRDLATEHDHYIYGTPKRGTPKRNRTTPPKGRRR